MNDISQLKAQVNFLVSKAAKAHDADDALKFSQAACNAANAIRILLNELSGAPS